MQQCQKTFLPWFQEQVRLDGRVGGQREASVQVLFRKKILVSVLLVGEDVGGGDAKGLPQKSMLPQGQGAKSQRNV